MIDPNEELVRRWLELRGYFVRTNVPYRLRTETGAGWSDVDICAINPHTNEALAVEVKGWHTERITPGHLRNWPSLFYFTRDEATAAIASVLGREDFRRLLVISQLGVRGGDEVISYARERGVEIVEFPTVLQELIEGTPLDRSAGSDTEHVIRVLKAYGFLVERARE